MDIGAVDEQALSKIEALALFPRPLVPDAAVAGSSGRAAGVGGDGTALAVGEIEIAVAQFQDGDVGVGAAALMREPGMREPGGVAAVLGDGVNEGKSDDTHDDRWSLYRPCRDRRADHRPMVAPCRFVRDFLCSRRLRSRRCRQLEQRRAAPGASRAAARSHPAARPARGDRQSDRRVATGPFDQSFTTGDTVTATAPTHPRAGS